MAYSQLNDGFHRCVVGITQASNGLDVGQIHAAVDDDGVVDIHAHNLADDHGAFGWIALGVVQLDGRDVFTFQSGGLTFTDGANSNMANAASL